MISSYIYASSASVRSQNETAEHFHIFLSRRGRGEVFKRMNPIQPTGSCASSGLIGTMPRISRYVVDSIATACTWRAVPEIAVYAIGMGVIFYFVDVLFMKWQGLALF